MVLLDWVSHFSASHFFVIKMNGEFSSFSKDRQKHGRQKYPDSTPQELG
jgi:hypothetical protein